MCGTGFQYLQIENPLKIVFVYGCLISLRKSGIQFPMSTAPECKGKVVFVCMSSSSDDIMVRPPS